MGVAGTAFDTTLIDGQESVGAGGTTIGTDVSDDSQEHVETGGTVFRTKVRRRLED
jgi:hypothetical protein